MIVHMVAKVRGLRCGLVPTIVEAAAQMDWSGMNTQQEDQQQAAHERPDFSGGL